MASMFGVDATTLAGPQGAGSQALNPVQERAVDPGYSGAINVVGGLTSSAGQFFAAQEAKDKNVPPWMGVRNEFQAKMARLSEAANQATDSVSRNRYTTAGRTLYNQYMADYAHYGSDYSKAISEAYNYNKTGSGWGEVEDTRKAEVESENKLLQPLVATGVIPMIGDMTPAQREAALGMAQYHNMVKKDNEELIAAEDRQIKMNAEGRAQQSHAFTTHQQTMQLTAQANLGNLLNRSVDLLAANTDSIKEQLDAGKVTFNDAWYSLEKSINAQRSQANIALQGDSQALSTYNSFYDNYLQAAKTYLDPATRTKASEDEFKRLVSVKKLEIAQKPGGLNAIVYTDLLGPDVMNRLQTSRFMTSVMEDIDAAYRTQNVPSVLSGDVPVQRATFQSVQEQMTRAMQDQTPNKQRVIDQAAGFTNSLLNSVGNINPSDPKALNYVNDYLASDAVAELVKQGKISPEMGIKAQAPIIQGYARGLAKQMQGFLTQSVGEATYTDGQRDSSLTPTRVQLLRFEPSQDGTFKVVESRDPNYKFVMSNYHAAAIREEANKEANMMSRTVRAYAHAQGHTNYTEAWNEVRHILVPDQYPTPDRVKEAMADGWDGIGMFSNGSSWRNGRGPEPTK